MKVGDLVVSTRKKTKVDSVPRGEAFYPGQLLSIDAMCDATDVVTGQLVDAVIDDDTYEDLEGTFGETPTADLAGQPCLVLEITWTKDYSRKRYLKVLVAGLGVLYLIAMLP